MSRNSIIAFLFILYINIHIHTYILSISYIIFVYSGVTFIKFAV